MASTDESRAEKFLDLQKASATTFLAAVIPNAVILASLQDKGFPKPPQMRFLSGAPLIRAVWF